MSATSPSEPNSPRDAALRALDNLVELCGVAKERTFGGIQPDSVDRARRLILALPDGCPAPQVKKNRTGGIVVCWDSAAGPSLYLSVTENLLEYYWESGEEDSDGTIDSPADLPELILWFLGKIA